MKDQPIIPDTKSVLQTVKVKLSDFIDFTKHDTERDTAVYFDVSDEFSGKVWDILERVNKQISKENLTPEKTALLKLRGNVAIDLNVGEALDRIAKEIEHELGPFTIREMLTVVYILSNFLGQGMGVHEGMGGDEIEALFEEFIKLKSIHSAPYYGPGSGTVN